MNVEKVKYPSINGLRAISIILVIMSHLCLKENLFFEVEKFEWLRPFTLLLKDGHFGVNVFFVISGFLITSLLLNERHETNTISLRNFYIRRTLRIFPAYYFLLLIYLVLQLLQLVHISGMSWLTAVTYTKYFNWKLDFITAHAWSLSIEEHFYLFWPIIFVYGYRYSKATAILIILAVPIIRAVVYSYPISWMNDLTIFTRIDSIATGCLFALYKDEILKKIEKYWLVVFYGSIITIISLRYFPTIASKIGIDFIFIPLGTTYGTIANFAIALLMMYSVFGPQKIWFKFLNLRVVNYIGLLSYSLYLWQQIFTFESDYWVTKYPQNLLFIFMAAMFSYHLIEKPFLKLKSRFSA